MRPLRHEVNRLRQTLVRRDISNAWPTLGHGTAQVRIFLNGLCYWRLMLLAAYEFPLITAVAMGSRRREWQKQLRVAAQSVPAQYVPAQSVPAHVTRPPDAASARALRGPGR